MDAAIHPGRVEGEVDARMLRRNGKLLFAGGSTSYAGLECVHAYTGVLFSVNALFSNALGTI